MALSKSNRSPGSLITVIPVYNGEAYLKATLESVASQTRPPDRLVILDDGSTDQTEDIVRSFKDIPCEWHPNPENGLFPNLNQALSWAKQADYFHLLLADDLIAPDFLEVSEQLLLDQRKEPYGATPNGLIPMGTRSANPFQTRSLLVIPFAKRGSFRGSRNFRPSA